MALGKLSIKWVHLSIGLLPMLVFLFGEFLIEFSGNHLLFLNGERLREIATTANPEDNRKAAINFDFEGARDQIADTATKRFFRTPENNLANLSWLTAEERRLVEEKQRALASAPRGTIPHEILEKAVDSARQAKPPPDLPNLHPPERIIAWIAYAAPALDKQSLADAMGEMLITAHQTPQPHRDGLLTYALSVQHAMGTLETSKLSDAGRIRESTNRTNFLIAYLIFAFVCISILIYFIADLLINFTRHSWLRISVMFIMLAALFAFMFVYVDVDRPNTHQYIGLDIFDAMFRYAYLPSCADHRFLNFYIAGQINCETDSMKDVFLLMVRSVNVFTALAVAAAIVGVISAVALPQRWSASDWRFDSLIVEARRERANRYLYFSSAILVFGILLIASWITWPTALFAEALPELRVSPAVQAEYANLSKKILLYYGINYTLVIVSFYVPVTIILEGMERQVAMRSAQAMGQMIPDAETVNQKLKRGNATLQRVGGVVSTLLPVLAPAMTGALAPLLTASAQINW